MYLRFAFEGDVHETLETIPLAVRRKLDLAGLKLSLAGWKALIRAERLALCHLPVDAPADLDVYREALRGFSERAGHPVVPLDGGPVDAADWGAGKVPAAVGTRIDVAEWAALSEEARYVLRKLADPKRDTAKFDLALRELRRT